MVEPGGPRLPPLPVVFMFRTLATTWTSLLPTVGLAICIGCGTTRHSDTNRTATEQLLISDAIDRAVQSVHLDSLAGQSVYLDDTKVGDAVDRNYLVSTLRQHLLASGCLLRDKREDADFIVEARAGAIGTDRNDLLFGVPSMNVPQIVPMQPVPAAIPEIPIAKRRDQRGIAKIAVFAYHRESGEPVWQSGLAHQESTANDVWILGAGPFQRGTIYAGTEFAGKALKREDQRRLDMAKQDSVQLDRPQTFTDPAALVKKEEPAAPPEEVAAAPPPAPEGAAPPTPAPTPPTDTKVAAAPQTEPPAAQEGGAPHGEDFVETVPEFNRPLSDYIAPHAATRDPEVSASIYHSPLLKRMGNLTVGTAAPGVTPLPAPKIEGP